MVLLARLASLVGTPILQTALQHKWGSCLRGNFPAATCSSSGPRHSTSVSCGRSSVPPLMASASEVPASGAENSGEAADPPVLEGTEASGNTAEKPDLELTPVECKLPWLKVPVFLGSQSASRRGIMDSLAEELGFEYTAVSADIDEKEFRVSDPNELVMMLAGEKANAIMRRWLDDSAFPEAGLLITADQVVVCGSDLLEKPASIEQAREFIEGYSNGSCITIGAVRVLNLENGQTTGETDICTISFDEIPKHVIDEILKDDGVLNCAGGLMIEHKLIQPYISNLEGGVDSIMGMNCSITVELMRKCCLPVRRALPIS